MKSFIIFTILAVSIAVTWSRPEELYTDEFDNVDEDLILASPRLVNNYINCAKTGQACGADGKKFRELLPEALRTNCAKCTEVQKAKSTKILKWIVANRPDDFLELENIFDKEHIYRNTYKDQLEKEGIVLPALKP